MVFVSSAIVALGSAAEVNCTAMIPDNNPLPVEASISLSLPNGTTLPTTVTHVTDTIFASAYDISLVSSDDAGGYNCTAVFANDSNPYIMSSVTGRSEEGVLYATGSLL